MLDTGLGMTLSCGMRGTALKTCLLESAAGTEFAGVKFPAHSLERREMAEFGAFYSAYYPVESEQALNGNTATITTR